MLPCPDRETLSRYLDGELDNRHRGVVEKHLSSCPACRKALAELGAPAAALKALERPARRRGRRCLSDETIAAWVEGRLGPKLRHLAASHLAGCPVCTARAGEISGDLEAIAAVRKRGLERVPEKLEKMTALLLGRPRPLLGRVAVELRKVVSVPGWWLELTAPVFEEPEIPYDLAPMDRRADLPYLSCHEPETAGQRAGSHREAPVQRDRWAFRSEGIKLDVGFDRESRCLVRVRDGADRPVPGAGISLKGKFKPISARTDDRGLASLGPLFPGRHTLRVDFGPGAEIEIEAR